MPTTTIDFIPPPLPGLHFNQTSLTGGTVSGGVDALAAIGIEPMPRTMSLFAPPPHVPLYPFQKAGVERIASVLRIHGGALLADDMGLGKTRQATVIADGLRTGKVLIVCPAAVRHQWQAEVKLVTGSPHFANLGPQSKKEYKPDWEQWPLTTGPLYGAVSYNLMAKALDLYRPDLLILDEPHNYLQSRGSVYNKAIWKHQALIRYKLALTGTPYLAKPSGLWSILYILLGMRFGKARDFDIRYCNGHQGQWGWRNDGATHMGELNDRLQFYMVRRMKSEVLPELPDVTRTTRWIEGTKQAQSALLNMDHTINGMMEAQKSTLLEKMEETVDVVSSASGPAIVFTWMKEHADQLGELLNKRKLNSIVIHGDWEAGERAKMVAQAKKHKLNVITTYGSSATGLDGLQHFSDNAVFHSINPVPAITLQAIDRLRRIGQKNAITATFIAMRGSVDELVIDKVINRLDVFGQILGRDKAATNLQDALRQHGLDNDKVLDAIFASLT